MSKITVYPTHENASALVHPMDGPISDDGSQWEDDAFTARMLSDNAVSTDPKRAHKFDPAKKEDRSRPPAHATGSGVVATGGSVAAPSEPAAPAGKSKSN